MKRRSPTPWKKSRTYGDIFGGRLRRRMSDSIFARAHSLSPPTEGDTLPILIQDNASRDFVFPVSAQEFAAALKGLPAHHQEGITHIWLRRPATGRARNEPQNLAEFICGSGVRVVVIYPWRADGKLCMGNTKPTASKIAPFLRYGASLLYENGRWYVHLSNPKLRQFYIEYLFCHEVGHHVDWYARRWSKANTRQVEEFADQYAVLWGADATACLPEI